MNGGGKRGKLASYTLQCLSVSGGDSSKIEALFAHDITSGMDGSSHHGSIVNMAHIFTTTTTTTTTTFFPRITGWHIHSFNDDDKTTFVARNSKLVYFFSFFSLSHWN